MLVMRSSISWSRVSLGRLERSRLRWKVLWKSEWNWNWGLWAGSCRFFAILLPIFVVVGLNHFGGLGYWGRNFFVCGAFGEVKWIISTCFKHFDDGTGLQDSVTNLLKQETELCFVNLDVKFCILIDKSSILSLHHTE